MNRVIATFAILIIGVTLIACEAEPEEPTPLTYEVVQTENQECNYVDAEYTDDLIDIDSMLIENSSVFGDIDAFIDPCKEQSDNPIVLAEADLKSFKIIIELDAIYPIDVLEITNYLSDDTMAIKNVDISVSLDGSSYEKVEDDLELSNVDSKKTTIQLNNQLAGVIKITFSSEVNVGNYGSDFFGLNDIRLTLGEGFIIKEATEWTDSLLQYDGWTGADGIFSFNLTNGNDTIGADSDSTLFLFSDTFIGGINTETLRRENAEMVNNTIGYYNGDTTINEGLSFVWNTTDGVPTALFPADMFIGYQPSNIINNIGLSDYNNHEATYNYTVGGSSWKSNENDESSVLTFDFLGEEDLSAMYIYNFVEDIALSTTSIDVKYSNDEIDWTSLGTKTISVPEISETVSCSTISGEEYLDLTGITARYIKITILDNNSSTTDQVGISKILFYSETDKLYATVNASSYDDSIAGNELTSRLWLQDGVVIGDYFYDFPILVKNYLTYFKVYKVGMIKVHIVDGQLDLESIEYIDTPLQNEQDEGSITYFGAGVMNMDISGGSVNQDGYIYVYGYKDFDGRHLTVARVEEENFENFNKWEYYNGTEWTSNIDETVQLIDGVSPELSVTYIDSGIYEGKYMLTVMENTSSGLISISFSDNPYGPFDQYERVYMASSIKEIGSKVFPYNAKFHPHLSEPGKYLISYNVNSTDFSAFTNGDIYRPRLIWLIETKTR